MTCNYTYYSKMGSLIPHRKFYIPYERLSLSGKLVGGQSKNDVFFFQGKASQPQAGSSAQSSILSNSTISRIYDMQACLPTFLHSLVVPKFSLLRNLHTFNSRTKTDMSSTASLKPRCLYVHNTLVSQHSANLVGIHCRPVPGRISWTLMG